MLDCLRPILDALGLDESREARRFLVAFDALLADAGTEHAALVHHIGHQNERACGDSRLQDWPDAIWKLNRQDPGPNLRKVFQRGRPRRKRLRGAFKLRPHHAPPRLRHVRRVASAAGG